MGYQGKNGLPYAKFLDHSIVKATSFSLKTTIALKERWKKLVSSNEAKPPHTPDRNRGNLQICFQSRLFESNLSSLPLSHSSSVFFSTNVQLCKLDVDRPSSYVVNMNIKKWLGFLVVLCKMERNFERLEENILSNTSVN